MPIVDFDGNAIGIDPTPPPDPPPVVEQEPTSLEIAKIELMKKEAGVLPAWNITHFYPTYTGIRWYMCNKIRKLLANIKNKYGYPVRFYHSMDTFSGIMFWINEEYRCYPSITKERWKDNNEEAWRYIIIQRQDLDFWGELGLDMIRNIPIISYVIDEVVHDIIGVDLLLIPIYENVAFYNTMNDILIFSNWGKIKKDLEKEGY